MEFLILVSTALIRKEKYSYWFINISSYMISLDSLFPFYSNICDLFFQQTNMYTMLFSVGCMCSTNNIMKAMIPTVIDITA